MSISIGAGYNLPEEQDRTGGGGPHDPERIAIVDDLNDKLQVSVHQLLLLPLCNFAGNNLLACHRADYEYVTTNRPQQQNVLMQHFQQAQRL